MIKTQTNKTLKARSIIIIGMFLLHAIASVSSAGELVAWGYDYGKQVSNTPAGNDFAAVAVGGNHNVALKSDGSLVAWGYDYGGQVSNTPAGNDFAAVSAGANHNVALKSDGSLVAWGYDYYGQVRNTPAGNDFEAVSAGENHNVALRTDGSLIAWGIDKYGQVSDTPSGNDFVAVSAGSWHNVAVKSDGSLVAWGKDTYQQVSNTPAGNDFVAVSAGIWHSVALKSDGSLMSWGFDIVGQVSDTPAGNDFVTVVAGEVHSVALKSDGSLVAWGYDNFGQVSDTPVGNDFVALAGGYNHNVAIRDSQTAPTYSLTTNVSPTSSSGYVTKNPNKSEYSDGEYVRLTATAYSGYTFNHWSGDATGYSNPVTIIMNSNKSVTANFTAVTKPTVTIAEIDPSAGEPSNNGSFRITRTGDTSENLLVYYSTSGTASSGYDYTALPGYVDIPSGQSSASIYVDVIDDNTVEDSETVRLTISSNAAYDIGSPSYAIVTIADDDEEPPTDETIVMITAPDASAAEPANDGYFTISRTGDISASLRVFYSISGSTASAGSDYASLPGYVYIPAGQSSANIPVDVIDDSTIESSETVSLTIRSIPPYTTYTIGSPSSATVTIADDDDEPPVDETIVTIIAPDASAAEPANDGYFTISRTGATSSSLRVYYSTSGSTASAGYDYAALSGYVDIPAGQTFAYVDVVVINDSTVESSETVRLAISSNAAYTIGSPSYAIVTIADDDDIPDPPVVDVEQMMADTLVFYYASIDDGSLVGVGKRESFIFEWTLEKAYDNIVSGAYEKACRYITEAYDRCDGENDIPDYVTGSAAPTLKAMIQEIIDTLGC